MELISTVDAIIENPCCHNKKKKNYSHIGNFMFVRASCILSMIPFNTHSSLGDEQNRLQNSFKMENEQMNDSE